MHRAKIIFNVLMVTLAFMVLETSTRADTYATFTTTKYYSANRNYYVEVKPTREATLYRVGSPNRIRQWTRVLPDLPGELLVTNDGKRVVLIDRYYGNKGDAQMPVVILFNQKGNEIANYQLGTVANLSRVVHTISAAHWYRTSAFSSDESDLLIETVVAKRDPALCTNVNSSAEGDDCYKSAPYQQLRFRMADGELISRTNIAPAPGGR